MFSEQANWLIATVDLPEYDQGSGGSGGSSQRSGGSRVQVSLVGLGLVAIMLMV